MSTVVISAIAFVVGWALRGVLQDMLLKLAIKILSSDKGREVLLRELMKLSQKGNEQ